MRSFAALLAAFVTVALGAQSPNPFVRMEGPIPNTGEVIGFGDVDGDSLPDLIVAGPPYVLHNDGNGYFVPVPGATGFPSLGLSGVSLLVRAIADVNLDGFADLIVASGSSVDFYMGTASSGLVFGAALPIVAPGLLTRAIAVGDIDGNNAPDLIIGVVSLTGGFGTAVAEPTVVLLNDGTGGWTSAGSAGIPPVGGAGLALGDVDADGDLDLLTATFQGVGTVFNQSGGTFGPAVNVVGVNVSGSVGIVSCHLNADAYVDAVVTPSSLAYVFFGGGPAGLSPIGSMNAGIQAAGVMDLNQDGLSDVVQASNLVVSISAVGPTGSLTPIGEITRVKGPMFVVDLDADGDQDLVIHDVQSGVNTEYLADSAGALHEQGPAFQPRYLTGGPVVIDATGDGEPDLVGTIPQGAVGVLSPGALSIGVNDRTGRFPWTVVVPSGSPFLSNPTSIAAGDFDGDGDQDLGVVEISYSFADFWYSGRILTNGGGGAWSASGPTVIGYSQRADLAAADMNGDGLDDLVFGSLSEVRIIEPTLGGFPGTVVATGVPVFGLVLADADQDGDVDIFIAGSPTSTLLKNAGGGIFVADPVFPSIAAGNVTVTDVDGDGLRDVLLDNHVYRNAGGTWAFLADVATGNPNCEFRVFDIEGDGDLDLVTGVGSVVVAQPGGATTLSQLTNPNGSARRMTPVDLDRDGDLDLMMTRSPLIWSNSTGFVTAPEVVFNATRRLTLDAAPRPGRVGHFGMHGAPGGSWHLWVSGGLVAPFSMPPFGTFVIDPASAVQLASGTLDPSGTADLPVPIPPSFSVYVGLELSVQAIVDDVTGLHATNARRVPIPGY